MGVDEARPRWLDVDRRQRLSAEEVVEAALHIIDREGGARFSLAAVAGELGVYPRAVSWHVGNREELLMAVVDRVFAEVNVPGPEGDWRTRLVDLAVDIRRVLLAHRRVVPLLQNRLTVTPATLAVVESAVDALVEAGARSAALVAALNGYLGFVMGYHILELAGATTPVNPDWTKAVHDHLADLSATSYPKLVHNLADLSDAAFGIRWDAAPTLDQSFRAALQMMLDGVAASLSRPGSRRQGSRVRRRR